MPKVEQAVQIPGEPDTSGDRESAQQELLRLRAENEALKLAKDEAASVAKLPQVVYEPVTAHGKAAMDASPTKEFTVEQVRKMIREGVLQMPTTSYLCKNGYYAANVADQPRNK